MPEALKAVRDNAWLFAQPPEVFQVPGKLVEVPSPKLKHLLAA